MTDLPILRSNKIHFGANHLEVVADLSEQDTKQILSGLMSMQETSMFWLGDFCLELEKRLKQPVKAIAETFGCNAAVLYRARKVCAFYPRAKRKAALSYTHHQTAMQVSGSEPAVAGEYLDRAAEERWSSRELRANLAPEREEQEPESETWAFDRAMEGLRTARRFLSQEEATGPQLERMAELVGELSSTIEQLM